MFLLVNFTDVEYHWRSKGSRVTGGNSRIFFGGPKLVSAPNLSDATLETAPMMLGRATPQGLAPQVLRRASEKEQASTLRACGGVAKRLSV